MALRLDPVVEQEYWGYWEKAMARSIPSLATDRQAKSDPNTSKKVEKKRNRISIWHFSLYLNLLNNQRNFEIAHLYILSIESSVSGWA